MAGGSWQDVAGVAESRTPRLPGFRHGHINEDLPEQTCWAKPKSWTDAGNPVSALGPPPYGAALTILCYTGWRVGWPEAEGCTYLSEIVSLIIHR